jgi:prephenate dehydrogenase
MLFDTACIVGVGLIGGSFGLAARERGLVRHVVGAVRREETARVAVEVGAVDTASLDLSEAACEADLIFMAPPVGQMVSLSQQLAPVVCPDAVITDGGSTKADIVRDCTPIFPQAHFVGGHPMAGSERTGVEAARADLFENAMWVLTPNETTPAPVLEKLIALVEGVGATPLLMNAATHDAVLAVTSHIPHLTASALVHLFSATKNEAEVAGQLVAGGWRDSTRIAAGSPEMWRDISLANSSAIGKGLDALIAELQTVRALLVEENGDRLLEWFDRAAVVRRKHNPASNSSE